MFHNIKIKYCKKKKNTYRTAVEKVLSVVTGNVKFQKTPDRKFTQEELSQYDTSDENKPVYVAVKGKKINK